MPHRYGELTKEILRAQGQYLIQHLGVPDLCCYTCSHDMGTDRCREYADGKPKEVQAGLRDCPKHHDKFQ